MSEAGPGQLSELTATELVAAYARRDLSPVEVMQQALERAHSLQATLNAFVLIDDAAAMAMAKESEQRWRCGRVAGLLDGVPVAVKDTANVKGWPTRYGSVSGQQASAAESDSPLVQRLREHGAAFLGKTATPEFAWKGVTDSAASGITRNPWNPILTPGGSSGGSAVAVATGIVPIATGADGGGSLRIPASFTGIHALKPTAGLIPNLPSPLGTLAVVGGLTRSAADSALFLNAVVAPHACDSFAAPRSTRDFGASLEDGVAGLRIGLSQGLGFGVADPEVARVVAEAADNLRSLGAQVEEVDLSAVDTQEAFETLWALGFAEILGRLRAEDRAAVEPSLLRVADSADRISGHQAQAAARCGRVFSARMGRYFESYDLLLTPTVPVLPLEAGRISPDEAQYPMWWNWTPMTWPFNLSRNPAASCPAGVSTTGLPIGVQLVGRWFDEERVLRASRALECFNRHPLALAAAFVPLSRGASMLERA